MMRFNRYTFTFKFVGGDEGVKSSRQCVVRPMMFGGSK
jgi:hypothetical protein